MEGTGDPQRVFGGSKNSFPKPFYTRSTLISTSCSCLSQRLQNHTVCSLVLTFRQRRSYCVSFPTAFNSCSSRPTSRSYMPKHTVSGRAHPLTRASMPKPEELSCSNASDCKSTHAKTTTTLGFGQAIVHRRRYGPSVLPPH